MLAEMMEGILALIKNGDLDKASITIDQASQKLLKQNMDTFNAIPEADLQQALEKEYDFTQDHMEMLSELFYAQGELKLAQNLKEESLECYRKSKLLLDHVIQASRTFSFEKEARTAHLQSRIDDLKA